MVLLAGGRDQAEFCFDKSSQVESSSLTRSLFQWDVCREDGNDSNISFRLLDVKWICFMVVINERMTKKTTYVKKPEPY